MEHQQFKKRRSSGVSIINIQNSNSKVILEQIPVLSIVISVLVVLSLKIMMISALLVPALSVIWLILLFHLSVIAEWVSHVIISLFIKNFNLKRKKRKFLFLSLDLKYYSFMAVVLKVWAATQTWIAKT